MYRAEKQTDDPSSSLFSQFNNSTRDVGDAVVSRATPRDNVHGSGLCRTASGCFYFYCSLFAGLAEQRTLLDLKCIAL